jgi:hypothetical protein
MEKYFFTVISVLLTSFYILCPFCSGRPHPHSLPAAGREAVRPGEVKDPPGAQNLTLYIMMV